MKALHAVVICLVIFTVFNYTAATLEPLIQQDNNLILEKKTASHNPPKASERKPGLIILGDPIDDPKPH